MMNQCDDSDCDLLLLDHHSKSGLHCVTTILVQPPNVDAQSPCMDWPSEYSRVHIQRQADSFCDCVH